jgi:hypothetical protein
LPAAVNHFSNAATALGGIHQSFSAKIHNKGSLTLLSMFGSS